MEVWANGERKVVSGGTHPTERDAVRAGERLLMQFEQDGERLKALRGNITLSEWASEWVAGLAVKQQTINSYSWRIEHWVLPSLGHFQLKNLTPQVIDRWANGLDLINRQGKKPLKKSCRVAALDNLRTCLNKAVKVGMLPSNPAANVHIETTQSQDNAEKEASVPKSWTYDECQLLLDASVGQPVEPLVIFGLLAGLRSGESAVVRWCDIDWALATVTVSRTISRTHDFKTFAANSTKTGRTRQSRLTSDAVFRLMRLKEAMEKDGPVAPDAVIYRHPKSMSTIWKQVVMLCKKAGVRTMSPHSLRHTHASLLLENGATLAAVAKQLGHSNPSITARVYWHLVDDSNDIITGIMDRALGRSEPVEATDSASEDAEESSS